MVHGGEPGALLPGPKDRTRHFLSNGRFVEGNHWQLLARSRKPPVSRSSAMFCKSSIQVFMMRPTSFLRPGLAYRETMLQNGRSSIGFSNQRTGRISWRCARRAAGAVSPQAEARQVISWKVAGRPDKVGERNLRPAFNRQRRLQHKTCQHSKLN